MANYYVNKNTQSTGEHEVHKEGCSYMPGNRLYLGDFSSCVPAVQPAKKTYPNSDSCKWCCPGCHTK